MNKEKACRRHALFTENSQWTEAQVERERNSSSLKSRKRNVHRKCMSTTRSIHRENSVHILLCKPSTIFIQGKRLGVDDAPFTEKTQWMEVLRTDASFTEKSQWMNFDNQNETIQLQSQKNKIQMAYTYRRHAPSTEKDLRMEV